MIGLVYMWVVHAWDLIERPDEVHVLVVQVNHNQA